MVPVVLVTCLVLVHVYMIRCDWAPIYNTDTDGHEMIELGETGDKDIRESQKGGWRGPVFELKDERLCFVRTYVGGLVIEEREVLVGVGRSGALCLRAACTGHS